MSFEFHPFIIKGPNSFPKLIVFRKITYQAKK